MAQTRLQHVRTPALSMVLSGNCHVSSSRAKIAKHLDPLLPPSYPQPLRLQQQMWAKFEHAHRPPLALLLPNAREARLSPPLKREQMLAHMESEISNAAFCSIVLCLLSRTLSMSGLAQRNMPGCQCSYVAEPIMCPQISWRMLQSLTSSAVAPRSSLCSRKPLRSCASPFGARRDTSWITLSLTCRGV